MCRIVQSLAEQPVIGLVQQLLKVRQIGRAVAVTFTASKESKVNSKGQYKPIVWLGLMQMSFLLVKLVNMVLTV